MQAQQDALRDFSEAPVPDIVAPGERMVGPFYLVGPMPTFIRAAGDEPSPLRIEARQRFSHDSNVYALPDDTLATSIAGSDNISETGVRVSYDNRISGQVVNLWADASYNDYRRFDELDHTAWALGGRWAWQLGQQWYGTLLVDAQRFLNRLTDQDLPVRNMITLYTLAGSAAYRLDTRWSTYVGVDIRDRDNSAAALDQDDVRENGIEAGFRFEPPESRFDSSFAYRQVDGRYSNRQSLDPGGGPLTSGIDNAFTDRSVLGRVAARPTAASRIVGELGWTERKFDTFSERDFDGLTGSLVWQWQASDAVATDLFLRKSPGAGNQTNSNAIDAWQAGVLALWRPTGKLTVSGQASRSDYQYVGDPAAAAGLLPERHDRVTVYAVGVAWEIRRNIELATEYRREERSSNFAVFEYDADIAFLSLRLRFD